MILGILSQPGGFTYAIIFIVAMVASLSFHEFSHALAATLQGDDTAKKMGRLTLDPRAHLDLFGSITFLLAGIGWAKPVPFNPYNLKNQKWGPSIVAAAGPLSNLFLVVVSASILKLLLTYNIVSQNNNLLVFLGLMVFLNTLLAVFNLIPIPPLDGSKFLLDLLKHPKYARARFLLETRGPTYLLYLVLIDWFLLKGLIFGTLFGAATAGVTALFGLPRLFF